MSWSDKKFNACLFFKVVLFKSIISFDWQKETLALKTNCFYAFVRLFILQVFLNSVISFLKWANIKWNKVIAVLIWELVWFPNYNLPRVTVLLLNDKCIPWNNLFCRTLFIIYKWIALAFQCGEIFTNFGQFLVH